LFFREAKVRKKQGTELLGKVRFDGSGKERDEDAFVLSEDEIQIECNGLIYTAMKSFFANYFSSKGFVSTKKCIFAT